MMMHRIVTRYPTFLSSAMSPNRDESVSHDEILQSIVLANDRAVRYMRKQQNTIAQVLLDHALKSFQQLPAHAAATLALRQPTGRRRAPMPSRRQSCSHSNLHDRGFMIANGQAESSSSSVKLVVLFNMGLVRRLQATVAADYESAIQVLEEALQIMPQDRRRLRHHHQSKQKETTFLLIGIYRNLSACYIEVADRESADRYDRSAEDVSSKFFNGDTKRQRRE